MSYEKYIVSYEEACRRSLAYITDLKDGKIKFIDTGFKVLNNVFFNGLQTNRIMVVAALSSVGKTTYVSQLRDNIINLNSNVEWLSFNFEMIASDIIDNSIVNELGIDLKTLYSVTEKMTDTKLSFIKDKFFNKTKDKPLTFVDMPIDYVIIANIIYEYWKTKCKPYNKTLFYDIDHALIVSGLENDSETSKLENLMKLLNKIKKQIANEGGHCVGIILSQIKRDLEDKARVADKVQHYPRKSDLAYSQALEHYADVIIALHNPSKLNLYAYGVNNFPIYVYENNATLKPIVYSHILKARRVAPDKVLVLIPDFEHFKFIEVPGNKFTNALSNIQKNKSGCNTIIMNT